jgi:opacity protein-like surface antigen
MSRIHRTGIAIGLAVLLGAAGVATAQVYEEERTVRETTIEDIEIEEVDVEPRRGDYSAPGTWGFQVSVGGGISGFRSGDARDFVNDVGGVWQARLVAGTRLPVAFEVAYVGSAYGIDAIGMDPDAILVGNGVEGLARLNLDLGMGDFQPYAFGGIGWRNYQITNSDFNVSNVRDDDNVGEIPLGVGLGYRFGAVVVDLRGTYRVAFNDDLIRPLPEAGMTDSPSLDTWAAELRLGWEF